MNLEAFFPVPPPIPVRHPPSTAQVLTASFLPTTPIIDVMIPHFPFSIHSSTLPILTQTMPYHDISFQISGRHKNSDGNTVRPSFHRFHPTSLLQHSQVPVTSSSSSSSPNSSRAPGVQVLRFLPHHHHPLHFHQTRLAR